MDAAVRIIGFFGGVISSQLRLKRKGEALEPHSPATCAIHNNNARVIIQICHTSPLLPWANVHVSKARCSLGRHQSPFCSWFLPEFQGLVTIQILPQAVDAQDCLALKREEVSLLPRQASRSNAKDPASGWQPLDPEQDAFLDFGTLRDVLKSLRQLQAHWRMSLAQKLREISQSAEIFWRSGQSLQKVL